MIRRPFAQSRMASRDISLASDSEPHDMKLTLGGLTSSEPDEDQVRLQLDVLLAESLATAQSMLGVDLITIFLLDQHQHLRPLHSTDLPLLWKVRRSTDAIVDKCFRQCETINVKDILKFRTFGPRFRPQLDQALGYRTKSMLCVPLVTGTDTAEPAPSGRGPSKALGVIQFTNKMRAGFEQLDPADDLTVKLNAQFEEESETIVVRHGSSGTAHVIDVTKFTSHDVDMAESLARAVAPVLALHRQHVLVSLVKTPTLTPGGNTKENDAHREDVRTRYLNAATALLTNVWANVLRRADEPSHDTVQSGLRRYRDRAAAAKNFRIQGVLRASRKLLQLAEVTRRRNQRPSAATTVARFWRCREAKARALVEVQQLRSERCLASSAGEKALPALPALGASECEPRLLQPPRARPPRISLPELVQCGPKPSAFEWRQPTTPELPTRRVREGRVLSEAVMRSAALDVRREKLLVERRDIEIDFIASKLCISHGYQRWFDLFPTVTACDESVRLALLNPDELTPPTPPHLCSPRWRRPPKALSDNARVRASREWPRELPCVDPEPAIGLPSCRAPTESSRPVLGALPTRAFKSQTAVRGWRARAG